MVHSLEQRSLSIRVGFHTRIVPSSEFTIIDDTISIEIKILEGVSKLVIRKRLSKFSRHSLKFIPIDASRAIFIKLIKNNLDFRVVVFGLNNTKLFKESSEES